MASEGFTKGDTAPPLTGTCYKELADGTIEPAPITGATAVDLHIRKPSGAVLTRVMPAVAIVSGPDGKWSYPWAAGELNEVGRWWTETQVTFSTGEVQTFGPDAFPVRDQIA